MNGFSIAFLPFIIETSGVWGDEAIRFSKELGASLKLAAGEFSSERVWFITEL